MYTLYKIYNFTSYASLLVYLFLYNNIHNAQYSLIIWEGDSKNVLNPLRIQRNKINRIYNV